MYSPSLTARQIELVESKTGVKLIRYDPWQVDERVDALTKKHVKKTPFTNEENAFIRNERLLSKLDYRYWTERHCTIELDGVEGGGVGKMRLWESQRLLVDLIGRIEAEQSDAYARGEPVDGILIADHKARQIGHTELMRTIAIHRMTLWNYTRSAVASVDANKIHEIYRRDKLIYDNLPFFLKPDLDFDVKDEHMQFAKLKSWVNYMESNMKSSFGQSLQHDLAHLTEVSEWVSPGIIEYDFLPTLPQSPMTLCVLESRANGRVGFWPEFTEDVRRGRKRRWRYSFSPWYVEPKKYRALPPHNWRPSDVALSHAQKVHETSPEFCGTTISLSKEQLYWWEATRREYHEGGKLNFFLTNYCATPEESFQHSGQSAFDAELLEELRNKATWGIPYEVRLGAAA